MGVYLILIYSLQNSFRFMHKMLSKVQDIYKLFGSEESRLFCRWPLCCFSYHDDCQCGIKN